MTEMGQGESFRLCRLINLTIRMCVLYNQKLKITLTIKRQNLGWVGGGGGCLEIAAVVKAGIVQGTQMRGT